MQKTRNEDARMAFKIVRNDITKIAADAIVNTANPDPVYMGGTDSAVYAAAGADRLLEERRKIGPIEPGQMAVTPAFELNAKYIFHTVGPVWRDGEHGEKETVKNCYINCLNKAVELGIESIAFPLISTGVNGFPKADALLIATSVFSSFLSEHELDITLVVFDSESFTLSGKIFAGVDQFIDENYVEEMAEAEYCDEEAPEAFHRSMLPPKDSARVLPPENAAGALPQENSAGVQPREDAARALPRRRSFHKGFAFPGSARQKQESRSAVPESEYRMPDAAAPVCGAAMASSAAPVQRSLEDVVRQVSETWSESLLRMITEKGYSDTEVYKRANVDRKHFSKIRSDKDYVPRKRTALAFALALKLNLDEAKDFLGRAGYAFSPSSKTDLIVQYFIENEVYEIMTINLALYEHEEPLLG